MAGTCAAAVVNVSRLISPEDSPSWCRGDGLQCLDGPLLSAGKRRFRFKASHNAWILKCQHYRDVLGRMEDIPGSSGLPWTLRWGDCPGAKVALTFQELEGSVEEKRISILLGHAALSGHWVWTYSGRPPSPMVMLPHGKITMKERKSGTGGAVGT
jgi:hypothetical protein